MLVTSTDTCCSVLLLFITIIFSDDLSLGILVLIIFSDDLSIDGLLDILLVLSIVREADGLLSIV